MSTEWGKRKAWRLLLAMDDGDWAASVNSVMSRIDPQGPMTKFFIMYDDDDVPLYVGVAEEGADFEPLDDYGMPNAGCTTIRYWNPEFNRLDTI